MELGSRKFWFQEWNKIQGLEKKKKERTWVNLSKYWADNAIVILVANVWCRRHVYCCIW
jgi:hypothetical protein